MLKLRNVFSDVPEKPKYFLNFTQGVQAVKVMVKVVTVTDL